MKFTIEGFSQEYASTLKKKIEVKQRGEIKEKEIKIDCTDLVILRWFVDFFPNMKKMIIDGKEYAWLTHKKMLNDLPLLDISKRACIERMHKLVEFGILEYKLIKDGGTFSLYGFGVNYINLVRSNDIGEVRSNDIGGVRSNDIGGYVQTYNKDSSINDSSINDSSMKEKSIKEKDDSVEQSSPLPPPTKKIKRNNKEKNQTKHKHGEYENVLLTEEEFEKLKKEFPKDYQERIERLSEYIASVGKSYKNHLATIKSWARKDKQQQSSRNPMGLQKAYTEEDYSEGWD